MWKEKVDTKTRAFKEGAILIQRLGYDGFTLQSLADRLKIKKPSLYDHFESKEAFVLALLNHLRTLFSDWAKSKESLSPQEKIQAIFQMWFHFSKEGKRLCPVSALTLNFLELSKKLQQEVTGFSALSKEWITGAILEGQELGYFRQDKKAQFLAHAILTNGMGCQLMARIQNDPELILKTAKEMLHFLKEPQE